MQTTSATWKSLWSGGAARLETVAVIAGTTYTEISTPVINRAVMQNGLSIGNAVSATCSFTVRTSNTIPKSAQVQIKMRLTDGTQTSEWLPAGTFYVSHRSRDAVTGLITLECYDALLKANAPMPKLLPWTTKSGQVITTQAGEWLYLSAHYPRSMATLMDDIALVMGVTIDPATTLNTGADYVIESVSVGETIHDIIGKIAAANGGNWIMTPHNTLKLVPVVSSAGAAAATENVVDVVGVVGSIQTSRTGTISGIRYNVDGVENVAGDESGLVLEAKVSEAVAEDLAQSMVGMTYQAYSMAGAIYDPAVEMGDYVRAGANGEVRAVLCAEVASLGLAFRGDMSAPEMGELADEYPYIGTAQRTLDLAMGYATTAAANAAAAAVQTFDNTLTQEEIFDRLTDGGTDQGIRLEPVLTPSLGASTPKRIVLDLDYAKFGTLTANQVNLGDYTSPISVPDENDPSTLLTGQTIDANGWITGGPLMTGNYVAVCQIADATPYRGQTITITAMTKVNVEGGKDIVYIESSPEVQTWEAAAYGALDSEGNLIGGTDMGESYKFTYKYTIEDDADSVVIGFECQGVKNIMVDFGLASEKELRYSSNIGIGYKGLQVGKFVVDRSGGVNFNGDINVNGSAGASGSFTVGGVTVTVTNGIVTNIA